MMTRYHTPFSPSILRVGRFSWVYNREHNRRLLLLTILMLVLSAYLLSVGKLSIPFPQLLASITGYDITSIQHRVLWNIRLPRVITAIFVGASLGVSGAIFQSISRNALGSPDIIGFTTGAASGALIAIVFFQSSQSGVIAGAITGGIITSLIVFTLARNGGKTRSYGLILSGIGMGAILLALNGLLLVKGDLDLAITANLWLAGSLSARTWQHALPVAISFIIILPFLIVLGRSLRMMEMGDEFAQQTGIAVEKTRRNSLFLAVILTSTATAASGPIAFIALAAPRIFTRLTGTILPIAGSAVTGAILLVCADLLAQSNPFHFILPLGQITSLLGGLYLLWLLTTSKT